MSRTDPVLATLIGSEEIRQQETLSLIPSENYISPAVREAVGSVLTNKYAEGYPGRRYYQGNAVVDEIEILAVERAKKLFGVPHANLQPLSGSPANLAILGALLPVGGKLMAQSLAMGGHLSMGQEASLTSKIFRAVHYGLTREGEIDWEQVEKLAARERPGVIFCGGTAFTKIIDFRRFAAIAEKTGAYLVADISHVAGLVAGEAHPSPVEYAHVVMSTTHKTLRGPRGALILVTVKGVKKDPEIVQKIDKAVFPGLQGGPHLNAMAGIAVALEEAGRPEFREYANQVVVNAKTLGIGLRAKGIELVGGGTENHLLWVDLTNKKIDGWTAAWGLEAAGLIANRQTIPFEPRSPYYPSGLRLGTPAVTSRGMKEPEMQLIAGWINEVIERLREMDLRNIGSDDKENDQEERKLFKEQVFQDKTLLKVREEVKKVAQKYRLP